MRRQKHESANLFSLRCEECGEFLVSTPSGYLACPRGHGKLVCDVSAIPDKDQSGSWFDREEGGE